MFTADMARDMSGDGKVMEALERCERRIRQDAELGERIVSLLLRLHGWGEGEGPRNPAPARVRGQDACQLQRRYSANSRVLRLLVIR